MFDLVIRGATIVTARERKVSDIGIMRETVAQVGGSEVMQGHRELDARGLYLLPGGVDPHVHLSCADLPMDGTTSWADNFEVGSRAAFAGGVTTFGNMTFVHPTESLQRGLERERELVAQQALADVFVHPVLMAPTPDLTGELHALFRAGQPSLKIFMSQSNFDHDFAFFFRAMAAAGKAGSLTLVHCEDGGCVSCCTDLLMRLDARTHRHYGLSRPPEAEIRAVQRAIGMCDLTGAPVYIVHLSTAAGLEMCRAARARGLPLFVETRPMYLHLTHGVYEGPNPGLYVGQPPLRSEADREALWSGVFDGSIDTLGSDHAPWTREAKLAPEHHLGVPRPGVADLETMLPMLFSEGVRKRGLPLERLVALTSENPAKLFGLYPRKGTIAEGSDADLVVWDPERVREVRGDQMQSRAGYSVYDGMQVTGWPKWTIRRGEIVLSDDGAIHGEPGSGRLLARTRQQGPLDLTGGVRRPPID